MIISCLYIIIQVSRPQTTMNYFQTLHQLTLNNNTNTRRLQPPEHPLLPPSRRLHEPTGLLHVTPPIPSHHGGSNHDDAEATRRAGVARHPRGGHPCVFSPLLPGHHGGRVRSGEAGGQWEEREEGRMCAWEG